MSLPAKDLRVNQIKIRLTDEEFEEVLRLAAMDRVPLAVKCRQLMLQGWEQESANLRDYPSNKRDLKPFLPLWR